MNNEMTTITTITFEDFQHYIISIRGIHKLQNDLDRIFDSYNNYNGDIASVYLPTLESELVELLITVTHDDPQDGWIKYWFHELDCGIKYLSGDVEIDGRPVRLQTISDLWDILNNNPNYEKKYNTEIKEEE